jgi:hypothetical protein
MILGRVGEVVIAVADRGWKRKFEESNPAAPRPPACHPRGRPARYIQKLPKAEQQIEEWQDAVEALLLVVNQNGPTMLARIGVMRALNRNVERVFNPDRKDHHWGRRKLARDR